MKKLSKLKLHHAGEREIAEKQMNALRGGYQCGCSCYFANKGGSITEANGCANANQQISSSYSWKFTVTDTVQYSWGAGGSFNLYVPGDGIVEYIYD